ncbi:MAG: 2-oxoacid:ferredoxin oxidoreductase subunit beta [Polyangiaceae bacterium]|nr:2-oxoacid:ferredoxin oxidoreductase subunit beta [Polyangiaceae bacterium]
MSKLISADKLTRADFTSDQEVRWCPGCGDYAILATVQRLMPEFGVLPHQMVWVSGIGCSSRFPYYMDTYGFHTIHGRAPAFATGIKIANPHLAVWMVTGDGDGLSIGGNHLMHFLRRNPNVNALLFNNEIYGLTKGQYSPTSEVGKVTKSTPLGSPDHPLQPVPFALGAGAGFVARTVATEAKHQMMVLRRANEHKGATLTEIFQNCNVFNDGAFDKFTARDVKADRQLLLEHGQPMLFGKDRTQGLVFDIKSFALSIVKVGENGVTEDDILVHDEHNLNLAHLLARMQYPAYPVALGVIYSEERPTYDDVLTEQGATAVKKFGRGSLKELLHSGDTWTV